MGGYSRYHIRPQRREVSIRPQKRVKASIKEIHWHTRRTGATGTPGRPTRHTRKPIFDHAGARMPPQRKKERSEKSKFNEGRRYPIALGKYKDAIEFTKKGENTYRVEEEKLQHFVSGGSHLAIAIIQGLELNGTDDIDLKNWVFSIQKDGGLFKTVKYSDENDKGKGLLGVLKIRGTNPVLKVTKKRRRLVEKRPIHRLYNQILDANNL